VASLNFYYFSTQYLLYVHHLSRLQDHWKESLSSHPTTQHTVKLMLGKFTQLLYQRNSYRGRGKVVGERDKWGFLPPYFTFYRKNTIWVESVLQLMFINNRTHLHPPLNAAHQWNDSVQQHKWGCQPGYKSSWIPTCLLQAFIQGNWAAN